MAHMVASLHQSRHGNSSLEQLWLSVPWKRLQHVTAGFAFSVASHPRFDTCISQPAAGWETYYNIVLIVIASPFIPRFLMLLSNDFLARGYHTRKHLSDLLDKNVCINVSFNCFHVYLVSLAPWRWLCFGARQEALGNWEARVFFGIKGAGNTELLGGKEGSKPNNK